jgi:uncharacterized phage protein (TIGR01671 family)
MSMRILKFRGKVLGEWWYVTPESDAWTQFWVLVQRETVDEYIGHPDSNNKEIYENDIIKNLKWNFNCQVVWRFHGFYYKRTTWTEKSKRIAHITQDEVAVIGNIHDNPELLAS